MQLIYTQQATNGLQECLDFLPPEVPEAKVLQIRDGIIKKTEKLILNPYLHLGLFHRRLVEGHYKIIYRIEGEIIYVTDIFDSRQDPLKMKG